MVRTSTLLGCILFLFVFDKLLSAASIVAGREHGAAGEGFYVYADGCRVVGDPFFLWLADLRWYDSVRRKVPPNFRCYTVCMG